MNCRLSLLSSLILVGAALTSSVYCMDDSNLSRTTALSLQVIRRLIVNVMPRSMLSYNFRLVQKIVLHPDTTKSTNGIISIVGCKNGTAELSDILQTDKPLKTLAGHTEAITGVSLSADGSIALTGSNDKTACLWDTETGEQIGEPLIHEEEVIAVGLSFSGEVAVTKLKNGKLCFWDARTGQKDIEVHPIKISSMWLNSSGEIVLEGPSYVPAPLRNLPKNCQVDFRRNSGPLSSIALSPDKTLMVTGSSDGEICLWNANTGNHIRTLNQWPRKVAEPISFVTFDPDGTIILAGSYEGNLLLFDLLTGVILQKLLGYGSKVTLAQFSADGNKIFVRSLDDLWSILKRSSITNDCMFT